MGHRITSVRNDKAFISMKEDELNRWRDKNSYFLNKTENIWINKVASKDDIEKLSPEDQAVLAEVGGRAGSIYMAEQTQKEADDAIEHYKAAGGTFKAIGEGDALYEELAAPLANIVDEWVERVSTDDFDATQVVDFIKERVAEY